MHVINCYLIITIKLRIVLEKIINNILILEMDRYSKTLKYLKFDKYIKGEDVLFIFSLQRNTSHPT